MRLLVLGGTGLAGRAVTTEAVARGHEVRTFSRHRPAAGAAPGVEAFTGDLLTGRGLAEANRDVQAVIDCTNLETVRGSRAADFFTRTIGQAVPAAARAEAQTYVLLSIVGVDRFPLGYYRAKAAQESRLLQLTHGSTTRPVIARVTQFHDFAAQSLQRGGLGPVAFVPAMRIQPVDLQAVARHLVDVAEQPGPIRAPDLAGPEALLLPDLVRRYSAARQLGHCVVPLPLVGAARRANRAGALLPRGGQTDPTSFESWLAQDAAGSRSEDARR